MDHPPLIAFLAFFSLTAASPLGVAQVIPQSGCFDLSKPTLALLKPAPERFPEPGKENGTSGKDPSNGRSWAVADATLELPLDAILKRLADPMTIRDPSRTRVESTPLKVPGALRKDRLHVKVKPAFFLTLEWDEEWLQSIKEGTAENPKSVVISYQKTAGTSHIEHFCGNILLERISDARTGIHLVEEIKADRRGHEDVLNGLLGTIRTLQK